MSLPAQPKVPSVTTGKMRDACLLASQYPTSRFTHEDAAASGDSRRTNHPESSSASVIEDHRCGLALRDDSSRNIRRARRFHHGLANRCKPAYSLGARRSSDACEYDTNPS